MTTKPIPPNWPVQPLKPGGLPAGVRMTCGACGLSWDDSIPTSMTPTPSARCPFENFHITLDDWVERFKAQSLDLDDVVEDHKSREADVINQGGIVAQVQYLRDEYGDDYLRTLLRAWAPGWSSEFPLGARVRVIDSDERCYINAKGTVAAYSPGVNGEWPGIIVEFDENSEVPSTSDVFWFEEIELLPAAPPRKETP